MDELSEIKKLKVLYIGGDTKVTRDSQDSSSHFDVIETKNGLSAINILKTETEIDGIISETHLPGMDGIEIFRMLRSKNMHPKTPFILVSHENDPQLKETALKERVDDFYYTPLDVESIFTRIKFLKKFKEEYTKDSQKNNIIKDYKIPFIKRTFDIFVSGFALLFLTPIFIVIALAIRLESKGKVYYTSKRVGTGYKIFDFYKFRSMYTGADAKLKELDHLNQYNKNGEGNNSPKIELEQCPKCQKLPEGEYCSPTLFTEGQIICEYWYTLQKKKESSSTFVKIKNDPRVTKVGKFIRNTSIDELPQLINVLQGDMSIVGNRPLPLYEAELLTSDDWSERFLGPAGITGLWQVELRGKKGEMSEEERKALDNQ